MAATNTYLTIPLTDRAPIRIRKDRWTLIASSEQYDNEFRFQANRTWDLRVRQRDDGRTVVYGSYDSAWRNESSLRLGELLSADHPELRDVVAAIRRVGEGIGMSEGNIQTCISDLPAEDFDEDTAQDEAKEACAPPAA